MTNENKSELRVYVINVDMFDEIDLDDFDIPTGTEITCSMPIEQFVSVAEKLGSVYSIGGFARAMNTTLDGMDDLSNSYVRFAWVNGENVVEETGIVTK